jgi:hypothetical protein
VSILAAARATLYDGGAFLAIICDADGAAMSDTPDAASATDVPKRRFRMGCTGFCICVFFLLALLWFGFRIGAVRALNAEMDALRTAGEPVTWEEVLESIEPIPDEENAALLLERHLTALSTWSGRPAGDVLVSRSDIPLGVRRNAETLRLMRICVSDERALLEALHAAAACPKSRWPVTYGASSRGPSMSLLARLRSGARLLSVETELRANDGDGRAAAMSVRAGRRLAASLDEAPHLISLLVRMACGAICVNAAERALGVTDIPVEDLAMLRDEFVAEAEQLRSHTALRTERAELIRRTTTGRRESFDMTGRPGLEYAVHCIVPGVAEMDALFGLKHMSKLIDLQDRPPRERLAGFRTVLADVDFAAWGRKVKAFFYLTPHIIPAMGRWHESFVRAKLRMHIARTTLAVEQFRMERGRWPEKLTDLVPDYLDAVPQDWFAPVGTPLSYVRTPVGVRVWARGRDNADGLAHGEWGELRDGLLWPIARFADREGRAPKSLDELQASAENPLPLDPRTRKPYSYVTNPGNPKLFILNGFTDGMTEGELWKQTMTTRAWAERHRSPTQMVVFRLLNPELRGATQSMFVDDVRESIHPDEFHALGYTLERLKALGFSDASMDYFRGEYEKMERAEEQSGANSEPDIPADTQAEARP